jgi:hypothetical protein
MASSIKVTRFGEFSHIGRLFIFGRFSKIKKVSHHPLWKVLRWFRQKMAWATFLPIFFTRSSGHPVRHVDPSDIGAGMASFQIINFGLKLN